MLVASHRCAVAAANSDVSGKKLHNFKKSLARASKLIANLSVCISEIFDYSPSKNDKTGSFKKCDENCSSELSLFASKSQYSVSRFKLSTIIGVIVILLLALQVITALSEQNHSVPIAATVLSDENFTFARNGSFLQLDAGKEWPFNSRREISFRFKTKSPHGLLIYQTFDHNKLTREDDQDNIELFPTLPTLDATSLNNPPVIPSNPSDNPVARKINRQPGETLSSANRFRAKRDQQAIQKIKQFNDDVSLNNLPSKAITATASEKLVSSLFSTAPAAIMNENGHKQSASNRLSLTQTSNKNSRDTNILVSSTKSHSASEAGVTSKTHRVMNGMIRTSDPSGKILSYGTRRSLDSNEDSSIFSSSAISSFSGSLYELYLKLENGRLKIMYEFGSRLNQTFCGKGLNDDRWHRVELKVDPELNQMILILDQVITVEIILSQQQQEDEIVRRNEFVFTNSVLYVGGLDNNASIVKNIKQRLYMAQFIGCIGQIMIKNDQNTETYLQPASIDRVVMVRRGCINKCETDNYCLHKSTCVNFYTHTKCDCFGTNYEDLYCWQDQLTTLSMLGYSTLIHRIYDWRDRHHSSINRLSIQFKTLALDSILFFAYGDSNQNQKILFNQPQTLAQMQVPFNVTQINLPVSHTVHRPQLQPIGSSNYLAVSLINGTIFIEISFGDGQPILLSNSLYDRVYNRTSRLPTESNPTSNFYRPLSLADGRWHNVTLIHNNKHLYLHVDNYSVNHTIMSKNYHLYFDPSIYVGAVPNLLLNETRILSKPFNLRHKFVGCLRSVYFNQHDILLSLKKGSPMTEYRDSLGGPRLDSCLVEEPSSLPLTIRSGKSYLTFQLTPNSQLSMPLPSRLKDSNQSKISERMNITSDIQQTNMSVPLKKLTKIQFEYKTSLKSYFLAGGHLRDLNYHDLGGFWTLHARENCQLYFTISSGLTFEPEQVIEINPDLSGCNSRAWFRVSISMISGDKILNMTRTKVALVDKFEDEYVSTHNADDEYDEYNSYVLKASVELLHQVQIGGDLAKFGESSSVPFSGCIRRIKINGHLFDSRDFVTNLQSSFTLMAPGILQRNITDISIARTQSDVISSRIAQGYVTLDSCRLVVPCQSSNPCENNGTCRINELGEPECDCSKTGYTGRRCHFSTYKQSCQELYLSGQRKSSHYLIDLDRNGPLKPIRVRCNMDPDAGRHIETVLSHNLPAEYLIRHSPAKDIKLDITYMAFHHMYTPDGFYVHDDNDELTKHNQEIMLRSLIGQSLYCKQYLKYECRSAPLLLGNRTWMIAPYPKSHRLTSLDGVNRGKCMCATTEKKCLEPKSSCNCDSGESFWTDDSYELIGHEDVGITQVVMLKYDPVERETDVDPNMESQSRLTLSDLRCYGTKLQESQHEITFKTSDAYIEVPGWRKGDISFSFRTASNPPAIILYQLASSRNHGYLRLTMVSDSRLTFEFIINRKPRKLFLSTSHKLNNGEWQQVFIEYDAANLRLTVNDDSATIDLDINDYLGSFEGPLFVGGAPSKYLVGDISKRNGFTGCFKGLIIAGRSIDLRTYLSGSMPSVTSGCKPSCSKNLCQNGGKCIEYWGSYECECSNPIAHSGTNCEINLNTNSITFVTPESYYVQLSNDSHIYPSFLIKNILLNIRTYQETALIMYASDHLNNFIQLHKNGSSLALTFNTNSTIVTAQVPIEDEESPRVSLVNLATSSLSQTIETNTNPNLHQLNSTNSHNSIVNLRLNNATNSSQYFMEHSIRSSNTSGSGQPIQIKIERHRLRTTFYVNNNFMIIEKPIVFLANYTQNPWLNPEMELIRPPRPKIGSKTYSQIFLANIDDYFTTRLPGFTGCIQGLSIDNQLFDFNRAHLTGEIKGEYRIGCKMHCDSIPCKHQGTCIENWKEDRIECKCDSTSYVGRFCDEDIAAIFYGQNSYLLYRLSNLLSSYPTQKMIDSSLTSKRNSTGSMKTSSNETEVMLNYEAKSLNTSTTTNIDGTINFFEVSLAFSTDSVQQTDHATASLQVLVLVTRANSSKHFFLGLTSDGSLLIQEDYGNSMSLSRLIKRSDQPFNDGYRHMFKYIRYNQTIQIVADYQTYLPSLSVITSSQMARYSRSSMIMVGNAPDGINGGISANMQQRGGNFTNYYGCISNLVLRFDDLVIEPLGEAFGQNIETSNKEASERSPLTNGTRSFEKKSLSKDEQRSSLDGVDLAYESKTPIANEGKRVSGKIETIVVRGVEQGKCASFKRAELVNEKRSINEPKYTMVLEPRPVYMDPPRIKLYIRSESDRIEERNFFIFNLLFYCSLIVLVCVSSSMAIYAYILQVRYKSEKFRCETPFFHKRDEMSPPTIEFNDR